MNEEIIYNDLQMVAGDIEGFIKGDWVSSDENWQALADKVKLIAEEVIHISIFDNEKEI